MKLLLFIFLFSLGSLYANYTTNWEKTFDNGLSNTERQTIQLNDGNMLYSGTYRSSGSSFGKSILSKITPNGQEVWQKEFLDTEYRFISKIIEDDDGNLIFLSSKDLGDSNYDIIVVKLDSSGNKIWEKQFGDDLYENASNLVYANNSIFILGTKRIATSNDDIWLFNLDDDGNKNWEVFSGGSYNEYAKKIIFNNNKIYIVGTSYQTNSYYSQNAFISQYDLEGNLVWNKDFDYLIQQDDISSVSIENNVINLVVSLDTFSTYNNNGGAILLQLNTIGEIQQEKSLYINQNFSINNMKKIDNGHIITGSNYDFIGGRWNWIAKIDNSFNIVWKKQINKINEMSDTNKNTLLIDMNDNIYFATSKYNENGNSDNDTYWENNLIKLDTDGNVLDSVSFSTNYTIKYDAAGNWVGLGNTAYIDFIDYNAEKVTLVTSKVMNNKFLASIQQISLNDIYDSNNSQQIKISQVNKMSFDFSFLNENNYTYFKWAMDDVTHLDASYEYGFGSEVFQNEQNITYTFRNPGTHYVGVYYDGNSVAADTQVMIDIPTIFEKKGLYESKSIKIGWNNNYEKIDLPLALYDSDHNLSWEAGYTNTYEYNYINAKSYCANLNILSHSDWRLPTENELQILLDNNVGNSTYVDYFKFSGVNYWSINQTVVNFDNSNSNLNYGLSSVSASSNFVKCVRDGNFQETVTINDIYLSDIVQNKELKIYLSATSLIDYTANQSQYTFFLTNSTGEKITVLDSNLTITVDNNYITVKPSQEFYGTLSLSDYYVQAELDGVVSSNLKQLSNILVKKDTDLDGEADLTDPDIDGDFILNEYDENPNEPKVYGELKDWLKVYSSDGASSAQDLVVNQDDSLVVCGYANNNFHIKMISSDGVELWNKTYENGTNYSMCKKIKKTLDGGYLLFGETASNSYMSGWVVKVDKNGTKEWDYILQGSSGGFFAEDLIETDDGIFIVGGKDNNPTILKLDKSGNFILENSYANPNVMENSLYGSFKHIYKSNNLFILGGGTSYSNFFAGITQDGILNYSNSKSGEEYVSVIGNQQLNSTYLISIDSPNSYSEKLTINKIDSLGEITDSIVALYPSSTFGYFRGFDIDEENNIYIAAQESGNNVNALSYVIDKSGSVVYAGVVGNSTSSSSFSAIKHFNNQSFYAVGISNDLGSGFVVVKHYGDDYDGDGVLNVDDAFPTDIAASKDTDDDGHPDEWNIGKTLTDSTTGLILDADIDGDNILNENDKFPLDIAASKDMDNDGYPDEWNTGKTPSDSITSLSLDSDIDGDGVLNDNDLYPKDNSLFYLDNDNDSLIDSILNTNIFDSIYSNFKFDPDFYKLKENDLKSIITLSDTKTFSLVSESSNDTLPTFKTSLLNSPTDNIYSSLTQENTINGSLGFNNAEFASLNKSLIYDISYEQYEPHLIKKYNLLHTASIPSIALFTSESSPQNISESMQGKLTTSKNYVWLKPNLSNAKKVSKHKLVFKLLDDTNALLKVDDSLNTTIKMYVFEGADTSNPLGYKEANATDEVILDLVLENDKDYLIKVESTNIKQMLFYTALIEQDDIYFEKVTLDENGELNKDFIVPVSGSYELVLNSYKVFDASISKNANHIKTCATNQFYSKTHLALNAYQYQLNIKGKANQELDLVFVASNEVKEIEPNDKLLSATKYRKNIQHYGSINKDDIDVFMINKYSSVGVGSDFEVEILSSNNGSNLDIALLDSYGTVIDEYFGTIADGKLTYTTSLPTGIYYVKLTTSSLPIVEYSFNLKNTGFATVGLSQSELSIAKLYYAQLKDELLELDEIVGSEDQKDTGNLIILTGDSDNPTDALFTASQKLSSLYYNRFFQRGLTDDDIYWFNFNTLVDLDNDGIIDNVVDESTPSTQKFLSSITTWAKEQDKDGILYIYLVDHGANGAFKISSNDTDSDKQNEILYATSLKNALDTFISDTQRDVVVIIEACKSGSFIPILKQATHSDKIAVITSSEASKLSYIDAFGNISFTKLLADEILSGKPLYAAYSNAKIKLTEQGGVYTKQTPLFLSGNDSISNSFVGGNFAAASINLTSIDKVKLDGVENNQHLDLISKKYIDIKAKLITTSRINKVWATVITPEFKVAEDINFSTPDLADYTKELSYDAGTSEFGASFYPPSPTLYSGDYEITVYVEDADGLVFSQNQTVSVDGEKEYETTVCAQVITYAIDPITNECQTFTTPCDVTTGWSIVDACPIVDANETTNTEQNTTSENNTTIPTDDNTSVVNTQNINLKKAWNLVALPVDTTITSDSFNDTFKTALTLWKYDNGWKAHGTSYAMQEQIKQAGIQALTSLNSGDGFWVNSVIDTNTSFSGDTYSALNDFKLVNTTPGWKLLGTGATITVEEIASVNSNIITVWSYDNKWSAYSPNATIMQAINNANFTPLESVNQGQGFWVLVK